MLRRLIVFSLRFSIFFVSEYLFFTLAPWTTCRPLTLLGQEHIPYEQIPSYAQCYYVNHGQIVFRGHPPLSDDPLRFVLYAGLFVLLIVLFFWSGRWSRRTLYGEGSGSRPRRTDSEAGADQFHSPRSRDGPAHESGVLDLVAYVRSHLWIATAAGVGLLGLIVALQFIEQGIGILIFSGMALAATALTGMPVRKNR
jgi:hypothetical protein